MRDDGGENATRSACLLDCNDDNIISDKEKNFYSAKDPISWTRTRFSAPSSGRQAGRTCGWWRSPARPCPRSRTPSSAPSSAPSCRSRCRRRRGPRWRWPGRGRSLTDPRTEAAQTPEIGNILFSKILIRWNYKPGHSSLRWWPGSQRSHSTPCCPRRTGKWKIKYVFIYVCLTPCIW